MKKSINNDVLPSFRIPDCIFIIHSLKAQVYIYFKPGLNSM